MGVCVKLSSFLGKEVINEVGTTDGLSEKASPMDEFGGRGMGR